MMTNNKVLKISAVAFRGLFSALAHEHDDPVHRKYMQ